MSIFIVDLNSIMHLVVYKMLHCKGAVIFFSLETYIYQQK